MKRMSGGEHVCWTGAYSAGADEGKVVDAEKVNAEVANVGKGRGGRSMMKRGGRSRTRGAVMERAIRAMWST